jgi:hypothetical protein
MRMLMAEGGLGEFDESWAEQYHQFGYRFDVKYSNMGNNRNKRV